MRAAMVMTAALGVALAGCGDREEKVAQADANASAAGFVPPAVTSRVDFATAMDRRFRNLDRNGDDRLEPAELPRRNSRIMTMDRNKDGAVSQIEWSEGMLKRFDQMDLNHDGTVTSEEENAWRAARQTERQPADSVIGDTVANVTGNAAAPGR